MFVTVSASSQKLSGTENSNSQNQLACNLSGHSAVVISQAVGTKSEAPVIAGVSRDKTIKIWNLNSGEIIHTLAGHSLPILALAMSRDGKILASSIMQNGYNLWPSAQIVNG